MALTRGRKRKMETKNGDAEGGVQETEVLDLTSDSDYVPRGKGKPRKKRRRRDVGSSSQPEGGDAHGVGDSKEEGGTCGICLSDDVSEQGKLDCCDHLFCFACIMEWSKIESKCPMCKQRFSTIVRPACAGVPRSRKRTVKVPAKNQVYEPSEEEISAMIAPQEELMCIYCFDAIEDVQLVCHVCMVATAHFHCVDQDTHFDWICEGCEFSEAEAEIFETASFSVRSSTVFRQQRVHRAPNPAVLSVVSTPRWTRRQADHARGDRSSGPALMGRLLSISLAGEPFRTHEVDHWPACPHFVPSPDPVSSSSGRRPRSRRVPAAPRPERSRTYVDLSHSRATFMDSPSQGARGSARRPIILSPSPVSAADAGQGVQLVDDEGSGRRDCVSESDISRAWTLMEQSLSVGRQGSGAASSMASLMQLPSLPSPHRPRRTEVSSAIVPDMSWGNEAALSAATLPRNTLSATASSRLSRTAEHIVAGAPLPLHQSVCSTSNLESTTHVPVCRTSDCPLTGHQERGSTSRGPAHLHPSSSAAASSYNEGTSSPSGRLFPNLSLGGSSSKCPEGPGLPRWQRKPEAEDGATLVHNSTPRLPSLQLTDASRTTNIRFGEGQSNCGFSSELALSSNKSEECMSSDSACEDVDRRMLATNLSVGGGPANKERKPSISADCEKFNQPSTGLVKEDKLKGKELPNGALKETITVVGSSGSAPNDVLKKQTMSLSSNEQTVREEVARVLDKIPQGQMKEWIREIVKAELNPFYFSKQICKEQFKEVARSATHALLLKMQTKSECIHQLEGQGSSSGSNAYPCKQCLREEAKQMVQSRL